MISSMLLAEKLITTGKSVRLTDRQDMSKRIKIGEKLQKNETFIYRM